MIVQTIVQLSKKSSNDALSWLIPILLQIWDIILDLSLIKTYLFDIVGNGRLIGNNNILCTVVDVRSGSGSVVKQLYENVMKRVVT